MGSRPIGLTPYRLREQIPICYSDGCYHEIMITYNTPALKEKLKQRDIAEYISGYVDGEGCFSVSFTKRDRFLVGWETKPSFSVSQNHDRAEVLYLMQEYFDAGFMRRDFSDNTLKYEVRKIDDLVEKVIPHFKKYPLLSGKQNDFELFEQVCLLMKEEKHKSLDGLIEITDLVFQMNPSGRRKYTKQDVLDFARLQMKI